MKINKLRPVEKWANFSFHLSYRCAPSPRPEPRIDTSVPCSATTSRATARGGCNFFASALMKHL